MNLLCFSDLHAHDAWPMSRQLPSGHSDRFMDAIAILEQVERAIEVVQPDDLLILGDVTHRRHYINFNTYNTLMASIWALTIKVRKTTIVVGNHDLESSGAHSLYPFMFLPNVEVVDRPRAVRLADGDEVFVVPYSDDADAVVRAIREGPTGLPLFAHYAAEGVQLESDYYLPSPLKLDDLHLQSGRVAIFGHIHAPCDQGQVKYVGSVQHFNFGDRGPRFAWHIQDGMSFTPVELTFPVFQTARWPRIPLAPASSGYIRILNTPGDRLEADKEQARSLGWRAVIPTPAELPPELMQAATQGLLLDRGVLESYVARHCADLSTAEQAELVTIGEALLTEAQG